MKRIMKTTIATVLLSSIIYAGGNKNIVPQNTPIADLPMMVAPTSSNFYLGLGLGVDSVSSALYGPDTTTSGVLRVGYDFMKYLGVEARGSYGVSDGDQLGHIYSMGLYLKPQYPINDTFNIYGLVGYAQTEISFENEVAFNGISNDTTTQSDVSFGIGVEYALTNNWGLFADVVRYIDKETTKPEGKYASTVDAVTFGALFRF